MNSYDEDNREFTRKLIKLVTACICITIIVIVGVVLAWKLVTPRLNLYKSNTEKQSVIKEQEAISEAAVFAAQKRVTQAEAEKTARLIEADAIAQAQTKIAATLTPEYLTWRYYEVLATTANQVIYVPASGVPLTEATRLVSVPVPSVAPSGG